MADDFLKRFIDYQESRDRAQEERDYATSTRLRLFAADGKTEVMRWRLIDLFDYMAFTSGYSVEWQGKHYRISAQVPVGVVDESPAEDGVQYEIIYQEITDEDPLRDYERDAGSHQLPEE